MTTIKNALMRNPKGAGRKPKPENERKLKLSVSLLPDTVKLLAAKGEGNVSQGIETLAAADAARTRRRKI